MADCAAKKRMGDRSWIKGRARPSVAGDKNPMRRHPERRAAGERHPSHKLTEVNVLNIRARYLAGETKTALGREYSVTTQAIIAVVNGETWKFLLPTTIGKVA